MNHIEVLQKWYEEHAHMPGIGALAAAVKYTIDTLSAEPLELAYDDSGPDPAQTGEIFLLVPNETQGGVCAAVLAKRARQDQKWGEQNHPPHYWTGILGEEYGELCEAINETVFDNGRTQAVGGYENMMKEASHVAAVAIGFMECLERNRAGWFPETEVPTT